MEPPRQSTASIRACPDTVGNASEAKRARTDTPMEITVVQEVAQQAICNIWRHIGRFISPQLAFKVGYFPLVTGAINSVKEADHKFVKALFLVDRFVVKEGLFLEKYWFDSSKALLETVGEASILQKIGVTLKKIWITGAFPSLTLATIATRFTELKFCDIASPRSFSDEEYALVASLPKLEKLCLSKFVLGGQGLQPFTQFTRLNELWLAGSALEDHHLHFLSILTNLRTLELSDNEHIQGTSFPFLTTLTQLKRLWLSNCELTAGSNLGRLTTLNKLYVTCPFSLLPSLTSLVNLNDLTHLQFDANAMDLQLLGRMTALTALDMSGTLFEAEANELGHFSRLTNLINLDLIGIHFEADDETPSDQEQSTVLINSFLRLTRLANLSLTLGCLEDNFAQSLQTLADRLKVFNLELRRARIDMTRARFLAVALETHQLHLERCQVSSKIRKFLEQTVHISVEDSNSPSPENDSEEFVPTDLDDFVETDPDIGD